MAGNMGVLTKTDIQAYLDRDELLSNPRRKDDGQYDIQPDSYDLTAGKAVWKDSDGMSAVLYCMIQTYPRNNRLHSACVPAKW